jgi:hypothetical protein
MKRFVLFVLVAGLVLAVGSAWALTLNPTSSDVWADWSSTQVYWDNPGDPPLLKTIVEGSSYWQSPRETLTIGGGAPRLDVTFYNGEEWASILIEVAGLKDKNYFGIYKKGDPTTMTQLFAGGAGAGTFKTFTTTPWHDFGFYLATGIDTDHDGTLEVGEAWWIWYTESSLNVYNGSPADTYQQHFAFIKAKPVVTGLNAYILGVEDLPIGFSDTVHGWGQADRDYNDFVVYVANIPDASTLMLFLSGMPALALLRRKRA